MMPNLSSSTDLPLWVVWLALAVGVPLGWVVVAFAKRNSFSRTFRPPRDGRRWAERRRAVLRNFDQKKP